MMPTTTSSALPQEFSFQQAIHLSVLSGMRATIVAIPDEDVIAVIGENTKKDSSLIAQRFATPESGAKMALKAPEKAGRAPPCERRAVAARGTPPGDSATEA